MHGHKLADRWLACSVGAPKAWWIEAEWRRWGLGWCEWQVPLSLAEDEQGRTVLKGLRVLPVAAAAAVEEQIKLWTALQKKEASPMHDKASRAHTVVTLTVHTHGSAHTAKLVLVRPSASSSSSPSSSRAREERPSCPTSQRRDTWS